MTLKELFAHHNLEARGVIHVGGTGEELPLYQEMGFRRILFVQSDPELFMKLRERLAASTANNVVGVFAAIGEFNGYTADNHRRLIPRRQIDTLLVEMRIHPREFNCLQGLDPSFVPPSVIEHFHVINGERNGSDVINLWQDQAHGRFANEIFQYFMARQLADFHGAELRTAPWCGQALFGVNDPLLERPLPVMIEHSQDWKTSKLWASMHPNETPVVAPASDDGISLGGMGASTLDLQAPPPSRPVNICLGGHYQFHTGCYSQASREWFRRIFSPCEALQKALDRRFKAIVGNRTLVALHLRRGDYAEYPGHNMFYITPVESYLKWLADIWPLLDNPVLYIASDDPNAAANFAEYPVITSREMNVPISEDFYVDFWMLTQADAMAISNSSFGFAAAMLNKSQPDAWTPNMDNEKGDDWVNIHTPMRPTRDGTLIPFDPWNADPLLGRDDRPEAPTTEEQCLPIVKNLLSFLDPMQKGVFIEVGLGTFAWYFVEMAKEGYKCELVEPFPKAAMLDAAKAAKANISWAVMGETDGKALLYRGRGDDLNSLLPGWWGVATGEKGQLLLSPSEVVSVTYPTVVGNHKAVACLKLDVEGYEVNILRTLACNPLPRVVMFEYGGCERKEKKGGWTDEAFARTQECQRILYGLGYRRSYMVENKRQPEEFEDPTKIIFHEDASYGNIICVLPL